MFEIQNVSVLYYNMWGLVNAPPRIAQLSLAKVCIYNRLFNIWNQFFVCGYSNVNISKVGPMQFNYLMSLTTTPLALRWNIKYIEIIDFKFRIECKANWVGYAITVEAWTNNRPIAVISMATKQWNYIYTSIKPRTRQSVGGASRWYGIRYLYAITVR